MTRYTGILSDPIDGFPLSLDEILERIGSHIYKDFEVEAIDFDTCEASLSTLTELADSTVFGIPEQR